MSLIETKKNLRLKQAEDYILDLIAKCPKLADISPAEMYDLPNRSGTIEKYEEGLRVIMERWKELYESTRNTTSE